VLDTNGECTVMSLHTYNVRYNTLYVNIHCMPTQAFTSQEVIELVGITPIQLNALVMRTLYGVRASVSSRGAKVRLFDEADVYGIALVWVLFESGLRTQQVRTILNDLARTRKPNAKDTAQGLLEAPGSGYIFVIREPRTNAKTKPQQSVGRADQYELEDIIKKSPTASVLAVPIGATFADIKERMELLHGGN
jgi:hypothetical protein